MLRRVHSFTSFVVGAGSFRFSHAATLIFTLASVVVALPVAMNVALCSTANAQTAHYSGSQGSIGNGMNWNWGIAVDFLGDVYIADSANNRVLKETPSGGGYAQSTVGSGLSSPYGVAVDVAGNVYIADSGNNRVVEVPLTSNGYGTQSTLVSGLNWPEGVAVDASGNVYIADTDNSRVLKETLSAGSYTQSTILDNTTDSGVLGGIPLNTPMGIAVDASGDIYIPDTLNNRVIEEVASGTSYSLTLIGSGLYHPEGVAVDARGNLYIADSWNNRVVKETFSTSFYTQSTVASTQNAAVAVDAGGDIFISIPDTNTVVMQTLAAWNFGTVRLGSTSSVFTGSFTFDKAGTLGGITVLTQGAEKLDFNAASTGTTCTAGTAYNAGDTCAVAVTFAPKYAGTRTGAVVLTGSQANPIATGYLQGTGSGPQTTFMPGTAKTVLSGLKAPQEIAVDASGNLYVQQWDGGDDDTYDFAIEETPSSGGYTSTQVWTGLDAYGTNAGTIAPGIAVDGSGGVYVSYEVFGDGPYVSKSIPYLMNGYAENPILCDEPRVVCDGRTSSVGSVTSIAVDGSGNLYFTENNASDGPSGFVVKETLQPDGTYAETAVAGVPPVAGEPNVTNGLCNPQGIAVDGNGNVYFGDNISYMCVGGTPSQGNGTVFKATPQIGGNYALSVVASGINGDEGMGLSSVSVDASGNVYVVNNVVPPTIYKETLQPGGSYVQSTVVAPSSGYGYGVAVDQSGNVYFDLANGGNYVNKLDMADPPALTFATTAYGSTSTDSPRTATVSNNGNLLLTFSAVSFPADFPESSLATGDCTATTSLAPGASCTLTIDFSPVTAVGAGTTIARSESVTIITNTRNTTATTQTISVAGTETKAPQTITFPAITGTQYALTQLTLSATARSGLAVSYSSSTTTVCTVSGSTLSLLVPGTCVLHAAQAGNSDYQAAPTLAQSFAVHAVPQTITFPAITGTQYALSSLPLTATASSGLAVSYTSTTPTVCTVSGSTASLLIAGTCVVDVAQAGNSIYAAAPTVAQSFAVHLVAQKMTFPAITQTPFALTKITLVATATSGLPVTITSITPTVCTVSGFTASLLVPGTCVLHAAQAGNSDYSPAPTLAQDFTVVKAQQSITFPAITGTQYALSKVTLSATATSGLAIAFTSTTPTVCTVSGSTASLLAPGTCVLHANQAGNTLYAAASMVAQSFSVHLIAQTITFPAITGTQYAGSQLTLTATATSGLAVAYTSTTTTVCTVSGNTASLLTAGTCVLHAAQAGNSDYAAAPALAQSFAVKAAAAN